MQFCFVYLTLVITYCLVKRTYFLCFVIFVPLNGVLMLIIYSPFNMRVGVIFIANKNKTSYDALLDFRFFMLCILCIICDAGK